MGRRPDRFSHRLTSSRASSDEESAVFALIVLGFLFLPLLLALLGYRAARQIRHSDGTVDPGAVVGASIAFTLAIASLFVIVPTDKALVDAAAGIV